jgi:DNA-binding transcriptional MerR regulator
MRRQGIELGPSSAIPDKLYFKIGEVAQLVGVQAHVLRYWEKEIPVIRPGKTVSNQRRYRSRDVEAFREVRRLLHQERYTLAGARRRLMNGPADDPPATDVGTEEAEQLPPGSVGAPDPERIERVRAGLREIIELVGEKP